MRALRQFAARNVSLVISCAVTVAGLVVFAYSGIGGSPSPGFAFVQNVELRSLDARYNLRGPRPPDSRIVIVDIDEKTLQREGAFPISRSAYARVIDRLRASGARIVAFDVTFPTPEKNSAVDVLEELHRVAPSPLRERITELAIARDNDRRLAESMRKAGNVILGHIFLEKERAGALDVAAAEAYFEIAWGEVFPRVAPLKTGRDFQIGTAWEEAGGPVSTAVEANIKPLAEAALSYGFFNNAPDADGTMRRAFLLYRYQELDWYPSLSFQAVREYLKLPDQELIAWMADSGLERIDFGPHTLRTRADGSVLINFAGPYGTYPHYSMADVLADETAPELFHDKIVLVGPTALGIGDIRHTPFAGPEYMGVEIHANVVDNLLHVAEPGRTFLVREKRQDMADIAAILIFGLLFGVAFSALRPLFSTLAALAGLAGFLLGVTYAFDQWGMWLSFVIPAGTLLVNYAAVTSYRVIVEEREKRKVRAMFSQYVAPSVIRLLEQDPGRYLRKGGELKDLTLMFTDIRGFTALSEALPPDEVVRLVNQHFDEMTNVLFRHWGTLDKYIGDAIMAFWGSPYPHPDHAQRGCACALEMLARLEELNRESRAAGGRPLSMGIGLNTGAVNVGNMGSTKRLTWTAVGDNVNLASRLEALTREYDCGIVLSDSTWAPVKESFLCRELDRIRVKGKLQPVVIYELLAPLGDGAPHTELVARFADALHSYRSRNWDEALRKFDALTTQFPEDGPSRVFRQRCLEFLASAPPPDWDGVYVMKSK